MTAQGSLCDIHRCPLYGRFRSELSARPPSFAVSLPVTLLGGFEFFALPLFKLALALLGLGDLPPVVLKDAAVTRIDVGALGRLAASPLLPQDRTTASNAGYCCTSSRCPAVQSAAAEFGLTLAVFRLALRSAARRCAHAGQSDCAADGDLTGCDMTGFPDY
jgi:hypothetical protein